jgi:hypothetical protein
VSDRIGGRHERDIASANESAVYRDIRILR